MIVSAQLRSARHALRWTVDILSRASGVSVSTIKRIEAVDGIPVSTAANTQAVKLALEAAGIEFIGTPEDGPGIRMRAAKTEK